MNNTVTMQTPTSKDLHIYYVQGPAEGRDQGLDGAYLGCWQEAGDAFLFFQEPAQDQVKSWVDRHPQLAFKDAFQMSYEEWQGASARVQRFGRFVVLPPGVSPPSTIKCRDLVTITLDPGLVFGSGTHTTTQDCLAALELACRRRPFEKVLDLGTGTGLLSLAAAKMGCERVLAIDLNRLAARTALFNVHANGLDQNIMVAQASALDYLQTPADLVMANIHFDVMRRMVADRRFLSHRWLILSGLLRSESRYIHDQLLRNGITVKKVWDRDGIWYTFLAHSSLGEATNG